MTSDIACITQAFTPMAWAALLQHFEGKIDAMASGPDKDKALTAWEFLVKNDMFRCGPWQLNVLHAKVRPCASYACCCCFYCMPFIDQKMIITDGLLVCCRAFFPWQAHKSACELLFSIFYKFGGCARACVRAFPLLTVLIFVCV